MRNQHYRREDFIPERSARIGINRVIAAFSIALWLIWLAASASAQDDQRQFKKWDLISTARPQQVEAVLAAPGTMYAATDTNHLITFNAATPGTIASDVAITGLVVGEAILGLDVRPATGELYALGVTDDGATRSGRLYTINIATGVATQVGAAPFSTTLADVDFFGMDFNPITDILRITNRSQQNLRVSPDSGALVGTDTALSTSGINGIAYDRIDGSTGSTTLYAYNFNVDQIGTIGGIDGSPSPNGGVFTQIGSSGFVATDLVHFDIEAVTNVARISANSNLYSVNLTTGAASLIGGIGGSPVIRGLTTGTDAAYLVGSAGADSIGIIRGGQELIVNGVNGGGTTRVPLGSVSQVIVQAGAGADAMTFNFGGGVPSVPVTFNGGSPNSGSGDSLTIVGGNFDSAVSNPINGHDGSLNYTGAAISATINYTGLEPINDTSTVTNYTINATNALNFINIINGPVVLGDQTTQVNDGAALFELVNFANKTNVTINALDGSDQISINNNLEGIGLSSLTVNGGNGNDTFFVNGTGLVSGNAYSLNGNADDDFYSFSGGPLAAPVSIDGGSSTVENAVTVFNAAGANTTVNGSSIDSNLGSSVTIANIQRVELSNMNTLTFTGTAGGDAFNLSKPSVATYRATLNGGTIFNFSAPTAAVGAQFFANSGAGDDTLTVDNTGRVVNLRVAYNAGANTDFLNVFGNPGSPSARESYIAGATADQGRFVIDPDGNLGFLKTTAAIANGDELDVGFNGLEPINTDSPSLIFDFCMSTNSDNASIAADGVLLNGAQSALILSSSNTFNNTRFANKTSATFSGFTSPDFINYSVTSAVPAGLTDVQFYGFLPPGLGVDDAPGSVVNPDVVNLVEVTNAVRTPSFNYSTTPSVIDITGLPQTMKVGTAETLNYTGTGANNDVATVLDNTAAVNPAHISALLPDGGLYKRNGGVGFPGANEFGPNLGFHGLGGVAFPLILDGNDPSTLPGDRLVYDGPIPFTNTPTGPAAGDITAAGVLGVRYARYEKVQGVKETATTLVSSGSPTVFGAPVTFTATVAAALPGQTPTGTVNFNDGANPIASCQNVALNGSGVASCITSSLSVGAHPMTAVYSGSANHDPSTSNVLNQIVIKANTTTTIVSDTPDPSVVGQNYTVTVAVAPVAPGAGTPAGNVTVSDGTNTCVAILPATNCVLSSTTAGAKTLTATYSGDGNFNGSVSATVSHTVNKADTTTIVQTAQNAPVYGQSTTITASLVANAPGSGTPQGNVNFLDGASPIAACQNVALNALGAATCSLNTLGAGTHTINVNYLGNANFNTSSGSAAQTVLKAPLNVTASSHTVTYGDAAPAVTSTITGFVLGESTANLGTQPSCSTTYTQGSPVSGSQYPTSCSGGVSGNYSFNYINGTVTVNKRALTVTADNKSRGYGAANPALTATLSGFIGADNAANSTTGTAGLSTTATATSPVGNYPITATLGTLASGNYSFATFTNGTLSVTAVQLTVTANNQTRVYGAPNPTLTYSITGFVNGEGVGALTGTPSITTSATATSAPGTYPITAAVGTLANPNYTFTTANGTLTVTQASTTTTITNAAALGNPTSAGQSYAVNWTTTPVAPATGTPTGNVTVTDGTATCTAAVAAGTCNLTSATSGTKTITATYAGDTNFAGSTSQPVQHNVVNGLTGNVKQFIAFGTNTNLAGVTMTLLNTATQQAVTTTTDANGNYSFSTSLGQSYTITPSGLGKAFEATSRTYTNVAGNIAGADFIAYDVPGPNAIPRSARISSQIATQGQPVTLPVLITANGAETKVAFSVEYPTGPLGVPTVTCGTGAVNCTLSVNNSLSGKVGITVTPVAPLVAGTRELVKITFPTFTNPATSAQIKFGDSPTAKDVRNAENNPIPMLYWTDGLVSFTGGTLLDGATIAGRVTTAAGQGLRNATVTLIDTAGGRRTTTTSSFGNYQFEGLELGRDYMIVVTSKRYRFATRLVNLTGNLSDVNLIGLE